MLKRVLNVGRSPSEGEVQNMVRRMEADPTIDHMITGDTIVFRWRTADRVLVCKVTASYEEI